MKAAVLRPSSPAGTPYAFPGNPAPASAISVRSDIPKPRITAPGELLIRVRASTVYRDNLEWNELYPPHTARLGNDFAGVVVAAHADERDFHAGDAVYGMAHANRGGQWAEYAIVTADEVARKPENLSWESAAAIPGSALTADQALFVHGGLATDARGQGKKVLVTGASGCVGTYLVRFAAAAGHEVTGATSSRERNAEYLRSIGARDVVEYADLAGLEDQFDVVVDGVGAEVLAACWGVVKPDGTLMSYDSCSWGYIDEHKARGIVPRGKEGVRALYFIVEPSRDSMRRIAEHVSKGLKGQVLRTVSLDDAREAYESVHRRGGGRGKIVVIP